MSASNERHGPTHHRRSLIQRGIRRRCVRRERKRDTTFKRLTALAFYRLMSRQAPDALRDYRENNLLLRGIVLPIGFATT